jgi:hypothetical protein
MKYVASEGARRTIAAMIAGLFLCLPLVGCGGSEVKKSPEEIEKNRQEHGQAAQREIEEG